MLLDLDLIFLFQIILVKLLDRVIGNVEMKKALRDLLFETRN